jgi:hypothetical protein
MPRNPLQYPVKEGCDPVLLNRPAGLSCGLLLTGGFHFAALVVVHVLYQNWNKNGRDVPMAGGKSKEIGVSTQEELILKVTKEIMVKFIEIGRISTTNFEDTFKLVNDTVRQSLK